MTIARLRLCFGLATLVASLQVCAEPRFWNLTGVKFDDGAEVTGYIVYDYSTGTLTSWAIRVSEGLTGGVPYNYVPATSIAYSSGPERSINIIDIQDDGGHLPVNWSRYFWITPAAPLDPTTPSLSISRGGERVYNGPGGWNSHDLVVGSLSLSPPPTLGAIVQVDEFYHSGLGHYFLTANPAEKNALDTGVHSGWSRTGQSFKAYGAGTYGGGSTNPVCRYYSNPSSGFDSHFYSADARECWGVAGDRKWALETDDAFQIVLPDITTGICAIGMRPVHRYWHPEIKNHRYVTDDGPSRATMEFDGYIAEGYGPDGVVMCTLR